MKTLAQLNAELVELFDAASKNVDIEISEADFNTLKDGQYALCFAKKVGDAYNVVWQSSTAYLELNSFQWTPMYELFGINKFEGGVKVKASTKNQQCGLGQTCRLSANGVLSPAVDGGSATALHFDNEYGPIHSGVNQLVTGIDGKKSSLPIYVSKNQVVKGSTDLTPKESVMVWFEQGIETSTMFSTSRSNFIEIDLTGKNTAAINYTNGKWTIIG